VNGHRGMATDIQRRRWHNPRGYPPGRAFLPHLRGAEAESFSRALQICRSDATRGRVFTASGWTIEFFRFQGLRSRDLWPGYLGAAFGRSHKVLPDCAAVSTDAGATALAAGDALIWPARSPASAISDPLQIGSARRRAEPGGLKAVRCSLVTQGRGLATRPPLVSGSGCRILGCHLRFGVEVDG